MLGRKHVSAVTILSTMVLFVAGLAPAQEQTFEPQRATLTFEGKERTYYLSLPPNFDATKTYALIVTIHGGGGNGRTHFLAEGVRRAVHESDFDAIVVSPNFGNDDPNATRFPSLGDDAFLLHIISQLEGAYLLHPKVFITGYSRGAQFCHRFAYAYPERVAAAAPCSSGTWTTPDGRLLIEGYGEATDPQSFLANPTNASHAPERLSGLFSERVAQVAGLPASRDAKSISFLVMCGSLDTRFDIAQRYVRELQEAGFTVRSAWPRTPHGSKNDAEFKAEFEKYSRVAVEFFSEHASSW